VEGGDCGLILGTVRAYLMPLSQLDCITSSDGMIVNNELEGMCKEAVVP
jgi:hypothetical protein